jgi:hypothetical protein
MTLVTFFRIVCDRLHQRTNVPVSLGLPAAGSTGLFVWPWKLAENPAYRNRPTPGPIGRPGRSPDPPPLDVHFLVLARPAETAEGLSLLMNARRAIHETSLVVEGEARAQLAIESLSTEELTALFSAAATPLTICLCVQGRGVTG